MDLGFRNLPSSMLAQEMVLQGWFRTKREKQKGLKASSLCNKEQNEPPTPGTCISYTQSLRNSLPWHSKPCRSTIPMMASLGSEYCIFTITPVHLETATAWNQFIQWIRRGIILVSAWSEERGKFLLYLLVPNRGSSQSAGFRLSRILL